MSSTPQLERAWNTFAAERYRRGETDTPSYEAPNPFQPPASEAGKLGGAGDE